MYSEEQYIEEQFRENFLNSRPGNIVLYGTGIHTKRLLDRVHSSRIVGLMDAKKTGENIYGYRVLSYEEAAQIENMYIVIIARNAVIHVIFRRIEQFCKDHAIEVFDVCGNKLGRVSFASDCKPCFCLDERDLKKKIADSDVVTFDIFDTLLTRCVLRPRDIFQVMDQLSGDRNFCFSKERRKAEDGFEQGRNPSIYEIYDVLQKNTGISNKEKISFLNLEIETEKKFLKKRTAMCDILEWSIQLGKEVYLISDMYFTKEMLEELLDSHQIRGYKDLFVSSELKKSKQEGLFALFLQAAKCAGKKCLHIGDSYYSDIIAAQQAGFLTFQIFSPVEMFESSIYSESLKDCSSIEENTVLSYFAVNAYNSPFCKCYPNGKLIIDSAEDMVRFFIAPVIMKFMIWMVSHIRKSAHDFVIFPSRDGYLPKKIYDVIQKQYPSVKLPESVYFYTSRRAALMAAASSPDDVRYMIEFDYFNSVREMAKARFDLDLEITEDNKETVFDTCMDAILKQCGEERFYYKKYIQGLGLERYENVAFVDFVAMGSVQEALQRIMNKEFTGYYFLKRNTRNQQLESLRCESLYKGAGDFQITDHIYQYYYFLETIMTSREATFKKAGRDGQLLFYSENRDSDTIGLLQRIHDVILEYAKDFLKRMPDVFETNSPVNVYDALLGFFSSDYSELSDQAICGLVNVDEFMGRNMSEINR